MGEPTSVGIQVCAAAVRQARMRQAGRRLEIVRLDDLPLSGGDASPDGNGSTLGDAAAGDGLEAHEANSTFRTASLPASAVMSRCWSLPDVQSSRVEQMVAHRLEAELPVPIQQLVWGFRRGDVASSGPGGERVVDILAQAARREQVQQQMACFADRGFEVDMLTTEAEALGALYRHGLCDTQSPQADVIVLAEEDAWLVALVRNRMVRAVRRLRVVSSQIEAACRDCRQIIEAELPIHELSRVLWCGGPELDDVRELLAQALRVKVQAAEPAAELVTPAGEPIGGARLATFGVAIGLSLAGLFDRDTVIRLARRESEQPSVRRQWIERIVTHPWHSAGAAAALLVIAAVIHLSALAWEKSEMSRMLADAHKAGSLIDQLGPKRRAMDRLEKYRIDVEGLAVDVCAVIPKSITLSEIEFARGHPMVIKGKAGQPKEVFELIETLRKCGSFDNVMLQGGIDTRNGASFTIKMDVKGIQDPSAAGKRGGRW